jgi:glutathione-regulated potassium-efflux system protein KefB
MPHEANLLQAAVVFLLAAVLTVPLAKRLQLGAVLGYLFAGVIIGPSVLGLIGNPQSVSDISELGVVLLLFIIGLELSPRRLWVMRKAVFGVGLAQVLVTGLVIGGVALFFFDQPLNSAVVLGLGLALSSTAFGLQSLAERKELNSPHGRAAFAILLFQDIAAIPLIAIVPFLAGVNDHVSQADKLTHAAQVVGSIAFLVVGGRYLLKPVFRIVAKTGLQEVSTATALLVVIGTAWLMSLVGVSMALGAFLAGMLLADSEYRHELESQIEPFKGLLLGLFFISVGMGANIALLFSMPGLVLVVLHWPAGGWPRQTERLAPGRGAGGRWGVCLCGIQDRPRSRAVRAAAVRPAGIDHHLIHGPDAVVVAADFTRTQAQGRPSSRA